MEIRQSLVVPVTDACDVLVCGGGFGGVSAALAAARLGKKVILLEKQYMLGGLGTAGLITIFLPLCDGLGHQVSFGLAEELLRLSVSVTAESKPEGLRGYGNWVVGNDPAKRTKADPRFEVGYNAQLCAILMEQALQKAGVELRYGTYAVGVHQEGDRIAAVLTESKSGRRAIAVRSVVDATGDADLAFAAGVPCEPFSKGNALAAWYYEAVEDGYGLKMMGFSDVPDENRETSANVALGGRRYDGLDEKDITAFVETAHASVLNDIRKRRAAGEEVVPATIPTIPQLRMTRRIVGRTVLDDKSDHAFVTDSVGMVSDWRKRGPVFEVPFSSLYAASCPNLIAAGRCTSVTEAMWDVMRVIPCCCVTGQAAGTAAAMTDDFAALDVASLQKQLQADKVVLHVRDLGL